MGKKIYDKNFRCCKCRKIIGEYNSKNRQRTTKSFVTLCFTCLNKFERLEEKYGRQNIPKNRKNK
jgi:oligoribonuclease NrnB/cAMP/cGMP phosphodiesterase (DHH superfamily)